MYIFYCGDTALQSYRKLLRGRRSETFSYKYMIGSALFHSRIDTKGTSLFYHSPESKENVCH